MVDRLLDWLAALPAAPTYIVLMVLSSVENVFPPVPADVAVALGAFLAQRGEISAVLLGILCWLANTASAAGMYYAGRTHGPGLLRSGWAARFMPAAAVDAIRETYTRYGVAGIFLSRFLPGFRAAVPPVAGVVGIGAWRALVPSALASAIWYAVIVFVGSQLGLHWERIKALLGDANRVLAVLACLAAAWIGFRLWRRRRMATGSDGAPPAVQ